MSIITASDSGTPSIQNAISSGATWIIDDWQAVVAHPQIDIIVECTGNPVAAVAHCLLKRGETVTMEGLRFRVLRADSRRLHTLQVERITPVVVDADA